MNKIELNQWMQVYGISKISDTVASVDGGIIQCEIVKFI